MNLNHNKFIHYSTTQVYDDGGSNPTKTKNAVFYGSFQWQSVSYRAIHGKMSNEWSAVIYTQSNLDLTIGDYVEFEGTKYKVVYFQTRPLFNSIYVKVVE
jgi:hypothetical protein